MKITEKRKLIRKIFRDLNKFEYVFSRDKNILENKIISNKPDDIDILIKRKDLKPILKVLYKHGYVGFHRITDNSRDVLLYNYKNITLPSINFHIDRLVKLPFIDYKYAKKSKLDSYVKVFDDTTKLIVLVTKDLFLTGILGGKKYSSSKKKEINKLLKKKDCEEGLDLFLTEHLGKSSSSKIITYLKNKKFNKIEKMRLNFKFKLLFNKPHSIKYFISNLWHFSIDALKKQPIFISFIGVDGSGKSTMINMLNKLLNRMNRKTKIIYMGRWAGHIIPIGFLSKRKSLSKMSLSMGELDSKKQKKLTHIINLILRELFFFLEYTLRFFFKLIPAKLSRKDIITDRYIYDVLIMKEKTFLMDFLYFIYPKPQKTFALYQDPKIIYRRKKELNPIELRRQQNILFSIKIKNRVKILSDKIPKSYERIVKNILLERNKKWYPFL